MFMTVASSEKPQGLNVCKMASTVPQGRDAENAAVLQPSRIAMRGGLAAVAASRRRGATMGSRVATGRIKEAVFPMFLDLAKMCADVDTFWCRFFETMSTGRFPKGIILRDDCLVHRTRKTTVTFELSEEARSDWQNVADFFRINCDIRSERDWELRRIKEEVVVQLTTAEINKRIKKEHANAIPEFALILKKRYSLTPAEMSEVDVLLRYYSSSNLFRPGDVVYGSSGAIREIKTLVFDEDTRRFTVSAEARPPRYATKESYQEPLLYLMGAPFTKPIERSGGFDGEIKKQLRLLYAPQIAAREKALKDSGEGIEIPLLKGKRKKAPIQAPPIDEDIIDDDIEETIVEEPTHRRHQSDDDSS